MGTLEEEAAKVWESMNALERDLIMEIAVAQLSSLKRPEVTLYHYASPEAFESIIRNRAIWFTNAAYMNDQGELSYPVALAREIIRHYFERATDTGLRRFLFLVARSLESHEVFKSWYVASFSTEGDLLSQWRAYCPRGGYSIGMSSGTLFDKMPERIKARIGPVVYDRDQQTARIKAVVEAQIKNWQTKRKEHEKLSQDDYDRAVSNAIGFPLTYEFVFFKSSAFAEEREWRMVQYLEGGEVLSFRERQGLLTPYIARSLAAGSDLLPIERIYVSPLVEGDLAIHGATLLLRRHGYSDPHQLLKKPVYRLRF